MDYTPIQKLLPTKPTSNISDDEFVESIVNQESVGDNDSIENMIDDIDNDIDLSMIDRIKGYIKLIVIIMILYFIVSNQGSLSLLRSSSMFGENTIQLIDNTLILTSTGLLISGAIMGLLFVLVKFALGYVAEI